MIIKQFMNLHASFGTLAGPSSAGVCASDIRAGGPGLDTRSGKLLLFLLPLIQEVQLSVTG